MVSSNVVIILAQFTHLSTIHTHTVKLRIRATSYSVSVYQISMYALKLVHI